MATTYTHNGEVHTFTTYKQFLRWFHKNFKWAGSTVGWLPVESDYFKGSEELEKKVVNK